MTQVYQEPAIECRLADPQIARDMRSILRLLLTFGTRFERTRNHGSRRKFKVIAEDRAVAFLAELDADRQGGAR